MQHRRPQVHRHQVAQEQDHEQRRQPESGLQPGPVDGVFGEVRGIGEEVLAHDPDDADHEQDSAGRGQEAAGDHARDISDEERQHAPYRHLDHRLEGYQRDR